MQVEAGVRHPEGPKIGVKSFGSQELCFTHSNTAINFTHGLRQLTFEH